MGKSPRGRYYGAGMRGQSGPSLLPVPVPSQVSRKTFIRAELRAPLETAPRETSGLEQTKMIGTYLECGKGVGWGSAAAAWVSRPCRQPRGCLAPPALATGCPGVAAAGEGAYVCARPEPLQHLCIRMRSSLFAGSAHWLARLLSQRSARDGFLCPLPPRRPHPPGFTSFAVI